MSQANQCFPLFPLEKENIIRWTANFLRILLQFIHTKCKQCWLYEYSMLLNNYYSGWATHYMSMKWSQCTLHMNVIRLCCVVFADVSQLLDTFVDTSKSMNKIKVTYDTFTPQFKLDFFKYIFFIVGMCFFIYPCANSGFYFILVYNCFIRYWVSVLRSAPSHFLSQLTILFDGFGTWWSWKRVICFVHTYERRLPYWQI